MFKAIMPILLIGAGCPRGTSCPAGCSVVWALGPDRQGGGYLSSILGPLTIWTAKLTTGPEKTGLQRSQSKPRFELQRRRPQRSSPRALRLLQRSGPYSFDGLALSQIGVFWRWCRRGISTALGSLAARPMSVLDAFRAPFGPRQSDSARKRRPYSPTSSDLP